MSIEFQRLSAELIDAGKQLYAAGMVPATSGNFSARLSNGDLALTVSGRHKGRLTAADILLADPQGRSRDQRRPSAESALHVQIYRRHPQAGAILHPHSVNATLLSRLQRGRELVLQDYELLKAFPGIDSHEAAVRVPVFPNDQDIDRLADTVDRRMDQGDALHGYLIEGHGFYTWGAGVNDALRHVEAFEFLFECEIRLRGLNPT
jgi:methylthioribulose-1-phosphate dehydratase